MSLLSRLIACAALAFSLALPAVAQQTAHRYPGQITTDWQAGRVPTAGEIAEAERDAAERPEDLETVRRLAKGYFFQYFGGKKVEALPRARATFSRALSLSREDAESIVYSAALDALEAQRNPESPDRDALFLRALAGLERAQRIAPNMGAVLAVSCATYLFFVEADMATKERALAKLGTSRLALVPAFEDVESAFATYALYTGADSEPAAPASSI